MNQYNIVNFLEKRKELSFKELIKSIERENRTFNYKFLKQKFKTKDDEYFARHYFNVLDYILEFVYNDFIIDTNLYNVDKIKVFKPILEEYVHRGEVPEYSLKEFE